MNKEVVNQDKPSSSDKAVDIFMEVGSTSLIWQITLDPKVYKTLEDFAKWWEDQKDMTPYVRFYAKGGKLADNSKPFPGTAAQQIERDESDDSEEDSGEDEDEDENEDEEKEEGKAEENGDDKDDANENDEDEDDDDGEGEDEEDDLLDSELEPTNIIPVPDDYDASIYATGVTGNQITLNLGEETVTHVGYKEFLIQ